MVIFYRLLGVLSALPIVFYAAFIPITFHASHEAGVETIMWTVLSVGFTALWFWLAARRSRRELAAEAAPVQS